MGEKKILIVDDDIDFVRTLNAHLKVHGYNVISASDGCEAVTAVQTDKPDLIILDVSMPGIGGLIVLKRLNKSGLTSLIPVIVVTGIEPGVKSEALAAGAVEFYVKPVNIDILLECIREQFAREVKAGQGR